jgi:hypothetical protein
MRQKRDQGKELIGLRMDTSFFLLKHFLSFYYYLSTGATLWYIPKEWRTPLFLSGLPKNGPIHHIKRKKSGEIIIL